MSKKVLTTKQRLFVSQYLVDKNATRAAKGAGFSAKTARSAGARLLTNVDIADAVEAGLKAQADKADISAERVIKRIAEYAFSTESLRPLEILKACELLGKHYGLFKENVEVTNKGKPSRVVIYIPSNGREAPKLEKTST